MVSLKRVVESASGGPRSSHVGGPYSSDGAPICTRERSASTPFDRDAKPRLQPPMCTPRPSGLAVLDRTSQGPPRHSTCSSTPFHENFAPSNRGQTPSCEPRGAGIRHYTATFLVFSLVFQPNIWRAAESWGEKRFVWFNLISNVLAFSPGWDHITGGEAFTIDPKKGDRLTSRLRTPAAAILPPTGLHTTGRGFL